MEEKEVSMEELKAQNSELINMLNKQNYENIMRRLDFLLAVVSMSDKFNEEFIKKCVTEIENILTIPEKNGNT